MLNKEQILTADDLESVEVPVPEWGGECMIRALTGVGREVFENALADAQGDMSESNIRATLAALSIVDEQGELMFSRNEVSALGKKSYKALDRVFNAAKALNGIGGVEDEIKN